MMISPRCLLVGGLGVNRETSSGCYSRELERQGLVFVTDDQTDAEEEYDMFPEPYSETHTPTLMGIDAGACGDVRWPERRFMTERRSMITPPSSINDPQPEVYPPCPTGLSTTRWSDRNFLEKWPVGGQGTCVQRIEPRES